MRCTIKKENKLKPVVVALIYSIVSGGYAAGELDLFGEDFSPSYDIKIKELNYEKNDQVGQPSGSFSFEKFKVITNDASIDLNNSSGFYDADIYVSNNLLGFKGEAARFAYRMAEEDFKYVNSFRWMKMANIHFLMDRDQIVLNGHRFAMQEPRTYFVAQSFDLNCGRHPDFLLNNGDGFLAGCLNFSDARSLQGEGFGIDYRLSDEEGNETVNLQGYFTDFKATQKTFTTQASNVTATFSKETELSLSDLNMSCSKNRNLTKIDEESLLIPCASEFNLDSSQIDIKMAPENDRITLSAAVIENDTDKIKTRFNRLLYSGETSSFSLRESQVTCGQPVGSKIEVASYIQGCLDDVRIDPKNSGSLSEFSFVMDDRAAGEEFYLNMRGGLNSLKTDESKIVISSPSMNLDIDRYLDITLKNIDWNCHKKKGLREFGLVEMIDYCKLGSDVTMDKMKILDSENSNEPIHASILPNSIKTKNNRIDAKFKSIYLADVEDFNYIKNLSINCEIEKDGDIFTPADLIAGCVKNSVITIPELYSQESTLKAEQLLNKTLNLEAVRITERHASMSDIKIDITNGVLSLDLKIRALGGNKNVSFSGPISWDKDKNLVSINVQKSKLPMGIRSKTIFMMVLKKFLVSEMITVPSKNVINIQL
jgi:hypothetical protein